MHRSYVDPQWMDRFLADHQEPLPKEVLNRFVRIIRVQENETVAVFDGQGREVVATIKDSRAGVLENVAVTKKNLVSPRIIIALAATEEKKLTESIRRGTEYGLDTVYIFNAQRSKPMTYDKARKRADRLLSVAIDSCRQSGRYFVPELFFYDSMAAMLKATAASSSVAFYGDPESESLFSQKIMGANIGESILIVVGPEGGLSKDECAGLADHGIDGVRWAPHVLRTELSFLAPLVLVNAKLGRA